MLISVRDVRGYVVPRNNGTATAKWVLPKPDILSEDVELRRIFPNEFPQDTIRRSGAIDPEQLGRYAELKRYFIYPKSFLNSHFEELICFEQNGTKLCKVDVDRYTPDENNYFMSAKRDSHIDRRRVYCLFLLCFTEDEVDRVVASF
ncbi:uncharacterized protein ACR2FA_003569 [Aphomia sociella]